MDDSRKAKTPTISNEHDAELAQIEIFIITSVTVCMQ